MKLVLDRIASKQNGERIATFECGEEFVDISENNMPSGFIDTLSPSDIIEAEIVDGILYSPRILKDETENRLNKNRSLLNRLRNRNKK